MTRFLLIQGDLRALTRGQGRVTSFYGSELQRYTSFKAHLTIDGPVRQILVHDKGIVVLGAKDVHMAMRRGPPIWHTRYVSYRTPGRFVPITGSDHGSNA